MLDGSNDRAAAARALFSGGGEMGARMREMDWGQTPLGPVERWPQSLRTSVSICLNSRFPMVLWWGPELILIYNDAWRPILGETKHPRALGSRGRDIWPEIWDVIGPMFEQVMAEGEATWSEDGLLLVNRYGFTEEAYFTWSYSPIRDESDKVGGVFTAVTETTKRVLGERRLRTLRDLGARTTEAKSAEEACAVAAKTLEDNPHDLPFTLLYLLDEDGRSARLAGATRLAANAPASPDVIEISGGGSSVWPLAHVVETGKSQIVEPLDEKFGSLPGGAWPEPPRRAVVLPMVKPGQDMLAGFLIAGLSPRLQYDDDYRDFMKLVAGQVATAIADARAYEEARARAEALAELDRAKTTFFSNVSHEFRTPLTLMLSPVEDILAKPEGEVLPENRALLEVAQRNGMRLLKLVNTLLDFSRIEAGRVEAVYEPVDLAAFTAELASTFRSTIEKAGLRLSVNCPPLSEAVYLDREMWEKIVLNLLSNAFKFTLEGEIEVSVGEAGKGVELRVRDTGVGIPRDELPHVFDRFHRVKGTQGRTHEGTGIGLALVQELARLHGGTVEVESEHGRGTAFTVRIPKGKAHLPQDRVQGARTLQSTALGAAPYVEEALRWLPSDEAAQKQTPVSDLNAAAPRVRHKTDGARILLADDNADMRDYVRRLLETSYVVEAVADGQAALEAARERVPDLVLSDVMMPRLDGFGLLRELRADKRTKAVPVILLSARAGEEAKIEGLEAGADDYLVKPFSTRELLARVQAHLELARVRYEAGQQLRESEVRFRNMADYAPVMVWVTEPDGTCTYLSQSWYDFTGQTPETGLGFGWIDATHPDDQQYAHDVFIAANEKHEAFQLEYRLRRKDGSFAWAIDSAKPRFGAHGEFLGYIGSVIDITERKEAEERLRRSEENLRLATGAAQMYSWELDLREQKTTFGENFSQVIGLAVSIKEMDVEESFQKLIHPDDAEKVRQYIERAIAGVGVHSSEVRLINPENGAVVWIEATSYTVRDDDGNPARLVGVSQNITERKRAETLLDAQKQSLETVVSGAPLAEVLTYLTRIVEQQSEGRATASVLLLDEECRLRNGASPSLPEDYLRAIDGLKADSEVGTCSAAAATGAIVLTPDIASDPKWAALKELPLGLGYLAAWSKPIIARDGRVLGTFGTYFRERRMPTAFEQQTVEILSRTAALTIERQRAEDALRASEERYRNLLDSIDQGFCVFEMIYDGEGRPVDYRFLEVNPTFERHTGLKNAVGKTAKELVPDLEERWVEVYGRVAETGEPLRFEQDSAAMGRLFEVEAARVGGERSRKVALIFSDITERRRAEEEREWLLEREQTARREAEEASRLKDQFLATVSHELRTPLTAMLGWTHILRAGQLDGDNATRALETIERNARAQGQLIEDLLDVSRIITGKLRLDVRPVDPAAFIEAAVEAVRPAAAAKGVRLQKVLDTSVGAISGDADRLQQVVWNLLSNAIKFTPRGGRVQIRLERVNSHAEIVVTDTGAGISLEFLPYVFDRFRQADGTTTRAHGGLGLGLSIVRHLVELHGGTVEADSHGAGQGATFTVKLPLIPIFRRGGGEARVHPRASDALAPVENAERLDGLKVLVVDDEADACQMLKVMLGLCGAEVVTADSAEAALAAVEDTRPDVLVSDIGMPGTDGYELIRRIRSLPPECGGRVPAIALTAYARTEDRLHALRAGYQMHVPKPVQTAELVAVIASLVARSSK